MALTAKDIRFVDAYMLKPDPSEAARAAGSSAKRARQAGYELLTKPDVAAEIERRQAERSKQTGIDAAWVLKRLAEEANADLADLYTDEGALKPVKEWPLIWRQGLVAGVEAEEIKGGGAEEPVLGYLRKIKLSDRIKRLELIGKHIGVKAFEETVRVKGLEGLGERLSRAAHRLKSEESNR